jgi:AcrR family transcriptional regulator
MQESSVDEIPQKANETTDRNIRRLELIRNEKYNLYLLSAVKAFQEKGYHATSVKDITDAAGTSVGNFYRYFSNKEAIFRVLVVEFQKVLLEKLQELERFGIPPYDVVKQVFTDLLNLFKEQQSLVFIYMEQMGGISKEYEDLHDQLLEEAIAEMETIISRAFELANIKGHNPRIIAISWIATFLQAFHWWAKTNFEMSQEDFVTSLSDSLLFGIFGLSQYRLWRQRANRRWNARKNGIKGNETLE